MTTTTIRRAATQKNMGKKAAYDLAFKLIDDAIKNSCPLQAITVEESILTDRLSSTLNVGIDNGKPFKTLGSVLNAWHPNGNAPAHINASRFDSKMESLYPALQAWRKERNELMHGIAKSFQCEAPEILPADFPGRALAAAMEGKRLVDEVKDWVGKQVRRAKRRERALIAAEKSAASK